MKSWWIDEEPYPGPRREIAGPIVQTSLARSWTGSLIKAGEEVFTGQLQHLGLAMSDSDEFGRVWVAIGEHRQ